jgi:hypothetical protein
MKRCFLLGSLTGLALMGCSPTPTPEKTNPDQPITPKLMLPEAETKQTDSVPSAVVDVPQPPTTINGGSTASPSPSTSPAPSPVTAASPTVKPTSQTGSTPAVAPLPFPTDRGAQAVLNALAPAPSSSPPLLKPQTGPKPRISDVERGELPASKVSVKVPSLPVAKAPPVKLTPPAERLNPDLGQAVLIDPAQVKLAPNPPTFRPVPQPPKLGADDLPQLSRRVDDRASLEDPTAELSAGRIINTPLPMPMIQIGFLKVSIPDPFELVEQLRGPIPGPEFGEKPANVPPARP